MNEHNTTHTITITELTFCELAQLVVDSLLHALQDLRYLRSLHKEEQVVVGIGS